MIKEELVKDAENFLQKKWGASKMLILGGDASEVLADFVEPREKRIEELSKEIENLKKTYRKQRNKRIDELQKENADLKCECRRCVYTDSAYEKEISVKQQRS